MKHKSVLLLQINTITNYHYSNKYAKLTIEEPDQIQAVTGSVCSYLKINKDEK